MIMERPLFGVFRLSVFSSIDNTVYHSGKGVVEKEGENKLKMRKFQRARNKPVKDWSRGGTIL
ncbi:hypothetical protein AYR63_05810 [Secundilactobacillus paracollinoides]|uniref:Uncharacterized protein n=1 Tax=Secundilactobacillus paracollinoides TaxID=240427 RepID=A0A1B2IXD9_9LACO|nr:hypothetical protein AYR63_05810 [Secundilactobacillus paracollinoides]